MFEIDLKMLDLCRICLFVVDESNCVSIFLKMSDDKSVFEIIKECSSVQISSEDDLPKYICAKCVEKLNLLYGFRNLIISSDLQLREKLNRKSEAEVDFLGNPISQIPTENEENHSGNHYPLSDEDFKVKQSTSNESFLPESYKEDFLEEGDTNFPEFEPLEAITNMKATMIINKSFKKLGLKKLEKSIRIRKKQQYKCEECDRVFKTAYGFKSHTMNHTGIAPFSCEFCNKAFYGKWALAIHTRVHTGDRPFTCEVCQKSFGSPSTLLTHKRSHTGVRNFNCEVCGRSFYESNQLEVHMRQHTGEKPFLCDICSKTFSDKSNMIRHRERHQGTLLPCPICGKTYKGKAGLQLHLKRHSGLKPFSCNECGQQFTQHTSLTRHKLLHSGLKPYKCKVCEKCFSQGSILFRHMRIHSGEKPYSCTLCPKEFAYKHHLQGHMKSHHKDALETSVGDEDDSSQINIEETDPEVSTSNM